MTSTERLVADLFARSNAYHLEWVLERVSGGANALWLVDWLTSVLDLKPGMKVLDWDAVVLRHQCFWPASPNRYTIEEFFRRRIYQLL